jgi:RHS repeat-associated protein
MGGWNFSYDQLNRLRGAMSSLPINGNTSFCWTYDDFGNRKLQAASNQAFQDASTCQASPGASLASVQVTYNTQNQVTKAPTAADGYLYDNAGNVSNDGMNAYLYDAEGRICAVNTGYSLMGYLYDAAGNRVAKGTITSWSCDITTNGFQQTAGYVVGPSGEQLTEVDANNNWVHTNVYAGGKLIGTYDSVGLHFYFDDPLGTRRAQTDASGNIEATYQSLPFGDGLNAIPYTTTAEDPTENHFTGKERDTESGLDYMFARYYNSATGRFLSPDWSAKTEPVPNSKLENPQTLNLYAYVGNNPLVKVDPDGHMETLAEQVGIANYEAWNNATSFMWQSAQAVHYQQLTQKSYVAVAGAISNQFAGFTTMTRDVDYQIFSLNSNGSLGQPAKGSINLKEKVLSFKGKTGDRPPGTCTPQCEEHADIFGDTQQVGRGESLVTQREWTYNRKPVGVWDPNTGTPALYEILHMVYRVDHKSPNSGYMMEYVHP